MLMCELRTMFSNTEGKLSPLRNSNHQRNFLQIVNLKPNDIKNIHSTTLSVLHLTAWYSVIPSVQYLSILPLRTLNPPFLIQAYCFSPLQLFPVDEIFQSDIANLN